MRITRRVGPEWLLLIFGLVIVSVITELSTIKPASNYAALSSNSSRPSGALAAYDWLHSLGYRVANVSSLDLSRTSAANTTLLLIQPQRQLADNETRHLIAWVRAGGVVVAAARPSLNDLYGQAQAGIFQSSSPVAQVTEPLLANPSASRIDGTSTSALMPSFGVTVAVARNREPALVRISMGRGILWLISAPDALDNAHLDHAGNPSLLLSLVGRRDRTVDFVALPPIVKTIKNTSLFALPWGVAILFGIAALLVFRWLTGWRLGPPIPEPRFNTRPATDYVVALAGLLRKARRRSDVLRMYVDQLESTNRSTFSQAQTPEIFHEAPDKINDDELVRRSREIVEYGASVKRNS